MESLHIEDFDEHLPLPPANKNDAKSQLNNRIDMLIERNAKDATRAYYKSISLNILNKFIRFLSIGTTLAIGVISVNLVINPGDVNSAIASAVLGFTTAGLIQASSEFNLQDRSTVLRYCYHQYNSTNDALMELKLIDQPINVLLKKLRKIQKRMNDVDIVEFDSTIINIEPKQFFDSKPLTFSMGVTNDKSNKETVVQIDE